MIKTLLYLIDDEPVAVLVRGDLEANEAKVQSSLAASAVFPADEETVKRVTGAECGFAGPVNLKEDIKILIDEQLFAYTDMVCGANKTDYHLTGIDPERDIKAFKTGDFTFAHPVINVLTVKEVLNHTEESRSDRFSFWVINIQKQ